MYIPSWAILVIILLGGLTAGSWVGKSKGDYNFISPILGGAIYVGGNYESKLSWF